MAVWIGRKHHKLRYIKTDNKHYLNLGVVGKYQGGEPKVMELGKCEEWKWFPLDALPDNLFEATAYTLRNFKGKKVYQPGVGL